MPAKADNQRPTPLTLAVIGESLVLPTLGTPSLHMFETSDSAPSSQSTNKSDTLLRRPQKKSGLPLLTTRIFRFNLDGLEVFLKLHAIGRRVPQSHFSCLTPNISSESCLFLLPWRDLRPSNGRSSVRRYTGSSASLSSQGGMRGAAGRVLHGVLKDIPEALRNRRRAIISASNGDFTRSSFCCTAFCFLGARARIYDASTTAFSRESERLPAVGNT